MRSRKHWNFPTLDPRKLAEEVRGGCDVILFTGRWELWISVPLKRSMRDHGIDWSYLEKKLWVGLDGDSRGFKIVRARVTESTLTVVCGYAKGRLDAIRAKRFLRIGPQGDASKSTLLEVIATKTSRPSKTAKHDDMSF